jgi:PAS domain S-box-containing protein
MGANAAISVAYLAISLLILVPTARSRELGSNKLAVATALIFFSCSVGHGLHAVQPALAVLSGDIEAAEHMNNWWLASWHTITAGVAVYYLTLRRLYGGLLNSAPLFHDLTEQERITELEQLASLNAARHEAESERDGHAAMLQAVIQNNQSMIYVKDLDGRYLLANRLLEGHFGLEAGSLVGRTDTDLDPELAPVWRANDELAREGLIEAEEWNESSDGQRHYYESVKFPLRHPDGEVYATCGISLDVTAKREAVAKSIERDAALAATAAKSAFLATMSHEIRTPMNAVIGMTDLLLSSELDDQQREYVETVRISGDALLALINDILDFSKIESGDLDLEQLPFDLRAEAEASLDLVLSTATRKGLELVCDVDSRCPPLMLGDVHRVRQILANLLANAVKFTERGEVVLTVETEPIVGGTVRVLASVTDTGPGIAPEHMDRLFRSFSQVDASITRVHGGSGLGLAISRRLAEAMGGELTLATTSPEGSTFVLDLVLESVVVPASAEETSATTSPLTGLSALLVDDNHTNLRILDYQLSILGLSCTSFASPAEALEQVRLGLHYDIAVLDMHMAEMDGLELGTALREVPQVSDSPLVLLTSLGWKPAGLDRHFAGFLTKPAKRALLHETVFKVLQLQDPTLEPEEEEDAAATPTRALRILLAEDNLINQRVAKLMLDKLGHEVVTVGNGYDAVEAVTSEAFDVVLMDVQMPQVDGLEATRRIRSRLRHEVPYIIGLTANALREDRDVCLAAGMHDYLSKPVRMSELRAVLSRRAQPLVPVQAAGHEGALDVRALEELLDGLADDDGPRQELIDQYLSEAGQLLAQLQGLLGSRSYAGIRAVTHTWRSTSALMGAARLSTVLGELEQAAQKDQDEVPALAQAVVDEYAQVEEALLRLRSVSTG